MTLFSQRCTDVEALFTKLAAARGAAAISEEHIENLIWLPGAAVVSSKSSQPLPITPPQLTEIVCTKLASSGNCASST